MAVSTSTRKKRATAAEQRIKTRWSQLPTDCSEIDLTMSFVQRLFEELGLDPAQIRHNQSINQSGMPGLKPDLLIYKEPSHPPVLVIELKKRTPDLAEYEDDDYAAYCKQHKLYRAAVGYSDSGENGILQYLDVDAVKPEYLASYGLVFNGDFFQLWRRVGGLVFPVTTAKKMTERSIVELSRQLSHCLNTKPPGLVTAIWNRKGGVGKTTNTLNIAASLALRGKRVLLVDLDPQNDLTKTLGFRPTTTSYLEEIEDPIVLKDEISAHKILSKFIQKNTYPTSDKRKFPLMMLSVNGEKLDDFIRDDDEMAVPRTVFFERLFKLLKEEFDYIFIDASPTVGKLTYALFTVSDLILPPMDFDPATVGHTIDVRKNVIPKVRMARKKRSNFFIGPWNLDVVFSNAPSKLSAYENKLIERLVSHGFDSHKIKSRIENRIIAYSQAKVAKEHKKPVICWRDSPATSCYESFVESVFIKHNYTDH